MTQVRTADLAIKNVHIHRYARRLKADGTFTKYVCSVCGHRWSL